MCDTQQTQQMPLGVPTVPSPDDDPLAGGKIIPSNAPATVGVKTPTKFGRVLQVGTAGAYDPTNGQDSGPHPTKFGTLMKFLGPALQGGLVGWAGGKGHPQGGFGAASDFFTQKRNRELQQTLLQRQAANDEIRNSLELARTQHELNKPRFDRVPPAIKGVDADGKPIIKTFNTDTGEWDVQPDIFPADKGDHYTAVKGDTGEYKFNTSTGDTEPITVPDPNAPATVAQPLGPKSVNPQDRYSGANASPQRQVANTANKIPLRPGGFSTPKPTIRASRNAAGVETDQIIDNNPNSPTFGKKIASTNNTRQPLPDRTAHKKVETESTAADIETYAGEALKRSGNDPDKAIEFMNNLQVSDPTARKKLQSLMPKIRQHIRDRVKPTKKRLTLSPQDAEAIGVGPSQQSSLIDNGDEDEEQQ